MAEERNVQETQAGEAVSTEQQTELTAEQRAAATPSKGKKKRKVPRKWIALGAVGAVVAGLFWRGRNAAGPNPALGFVEDTAQKRDIVTYHSFTGTVEPVTSKALTTTVTGVKILEVNFEKGDEVKKGDVIATLDTKTLDNQIEQSQATLDQTTAQGQAQVKQAQTNYDNLKESTANGTNQALSSAQNQLKSAQKSYSDLKNNLATGTEPSILQARTQMETAKANYDNLQNNIAKNLDPSLQQAQNTVNQAFQGLLTAQEQYNNEVKLNNQQLSATISAAQQQVDGAYGQLTAAQMQLTQARENKSNAEAAANESASGIGELLASITGSPAGGSYNSATYDQAITAAQNGVDNAERSYQNAKDNYEAAKQNEENQLTMLYDALITAQTSYISAVDGYNATVNSLRQQLETYGRTYNDAVTSYNAAVNAANQQLGTLANQVGAASDSLAAARTSNSDQLELYEQQVEQAKTGADQKPAKVQIDQLKESKDDYRIVAPIDGEITELNLTEGEVLGASTAAATTGLGTVTDFSKMKLDIQIGEYDILGVEEGAPVLITLDALNKTYDGKITYISHEATVNSGVSYFEAEVEFDADEDARSGMSAEVKLTVNDLQDVLTVPSDAVHTETNGSSYVYIQGKSGSNMQKQTVELGATDGTYTEITGGLSDGDEILYQPTQNNDMYQLMMGGPEGAQGAE